MRDNFIKAAARLQASGLGTAARLTRPLRLIMLYYVNLGRCNLLIFLQKKQAVFAVHKTP